MSDPEAELMKIAKKTWRLAELVLMYAGAIDARNWTAEIAHPGLSTLQRQAWEAALDLVGKDVGHELIRIGGQPDKLKLLDDRAWAKFAHPEEAQQRAKLVADICELVQTSGFMTGHMEALSTETLKDLQDEVGAFLASHPRKSCLERIMEESDVKKA